jgi:hypothetical protein
MTVRYEAVNAMLLDEFLKNYRTDQDQGRKLREQKLTIARLEALVAQQQKQTEVRPARALVVTNQSYPDFFTNRADSATSALAITVFK